MITFTLVAILGILLLIVLRELFKRSAPKEPVKAKPDLASLKISDARVGDMISVPGAGQDFTDLDFTVDRRSRYAAGGKEWIELGGAYRERPVAIEFSEGDELQAASVNAEKLTLEDLGLSEEDLAQMDERQNTGDHFEFEDKRWYYRFSKEAVLYREGQSQGRGFYCWKFEEEGGKRSVWIRKWEGEPFEAILTTRLNPADITVYRAG